MPCCLFHRLEREPAGPQRRGGSRIRINAGRPPVGFHHITPSIGFLRKTGSLEAPTSRASSAQHGCAIHSQQQNGTRGANRLSHALPLAAKPGRVSTRCGRSAHHLLSSCRPHTSPWISSRGQQRKASLIRVADFRARYARRALVPPRRAARRISHHLVHLLAFMQERRWLTLWQWKRAGYRISAGRTGRSPSLTFQSIVAHKASTKQQALQALCGFCTFSTAPVRAPLQV